MASSDPLPRRRSRHVKTSAFSRSANASLDHPLPTGMMILQKGATFHTPTTPPSESTVTFPPGLSPLKRSPTDVMDLGEDVVQRGQRIAALIGSFDRDFSESGSTSSSTTCTLPVREVSVSPKGLPEDRFMTGLTSEVDPSETGHSRRSSHAGFRDATGLRERQARSNVKHHTSDSGIGSTVSGTIITAEQDGRAEIAARDGGMTLRSASAVRAGVMAPAPLSLIGNHALASATRNEKGRGISLEGRRQIDKRILQPLSHNQAWKEFHPLIDDVPRRINLKEILCLRDLEKALVFLSPARAKSPDSYLSFCETWIHCFHAAVDHISERDQRRPTDAPYTNGYFLDLVAQVRNYAREMAASRQRQAAGEPAGAMDYSPSERVVLEGGLSQTGRPAQLVRVKNGQSIPIHHHGPEESPEARAQKESGAPPLMKRSLSVQTDEDSVQRSMARRRKLGPGETVSEPAPQICQQCRKSFKRPCDLTKHEKTHSRPFKCTEVTCKYHTYGWPTETERDRHVNDKHSADPAMFPCLFPPCTYKSKRESNQKQHMEKAHGWVYHRIKGNRKKAQKTKSPSTPQTPLTPQNATSHPPSIAATTPMTHDSSGQGHFSPVELSKPAFEDLLREHLGGDRPGDAPETFEGPEQPFSFNDFPGGHFTAFNPSSGRALASISPHDLAQGSFDPSLTSSFSDNHGFGGQVELLNDSSSLYDYNVQLLTPNLSHGRRPSGSFIQSPDQEVHGIPEQSPLRPTANMSPCEQADVMLYSPVSLEGALDDEGIGGFLPQSTGLIQDFPLYPYGPTLDTPDNMFQDLSSFGNRYEQPGPSAFVSGDSQPTVSLMDVMQMDASPDI